MIVDATAALLVGASVMVTVFEVAVCALRDRGWGESSNDRERAVVLGMDAGDDGDMGNHLGQVGHGEMSEEGARALM